MGSINGTRFVHNPAEAGDSINTFIGTSAGHYDGMTFIVSGA